CARRGTGPAWFVYW
nr:immunoglobulin heavy chain junction region [Mus musculus]NSM04583.1 immunoglobulin heavy chain junction region [Mus musculus]NSM04605.1 immunoglobulin heavy chain junction region [Mus musculus]NSM04692.1 immunoglobulin heavy chain junction region [Mus musculus]NSM04709.1 immunoglobulin heavy chain junction region [Mus musculus]